MSLEGPISSFQSQAMSTSSSTVTTGPQPPNANKTMSFFMSPLSSNSSALFQSPINSATYQLLPRRRRDNSVRRSPVAGGVDGLAASVGVDAGGAGDRQQRLVQLF